MRAVLALVFAVACAEAPDEASDASERWAEAQAAWQRGEARAYGLWKDLDAETSAGREAHRRLAQADPFYREGVELLRRGDPEARHVLAAGVEVAPMDPSLYLPLARACRDQGLSLRAAEYYSKFLTAFPEGDRAEEARAELRRLDPQLAGVFETSTVLPRAPAAPQRSPWLLVLAGLLLGGVLTLTAQTVIRFQRTRGVSLERLVGGSPEFHPAIAYLVGSLRHELLKHRIGAAADALGRDTPIDEERLAFLRKRLYGGQPLADAWEAHLSAFERALGHRVDLHRDRSFRRAGRAIRRIARLEDRIASGSAAALAELGEAHRVLMDLDRQLAALIGALIRTDIDRSLLEEVVREVRAEHSPGRVALEALTVEAPDEPVTLDVFRVDLVLILKNILRNAVLAVGEDPPPRHVRLDAVLELEATGEETVRIRVHDSSAKTLDPEILFDRRVDRGLGLVAAAVHRYGGTIDVEPSDPPHAKRVVVAFFRTFTD